jgi:PilZ domain
VSYALTTIAAIKSSGQQELARHWDRLAAGRRFPDPRGFTLPPELSDPTRLNVWNVEGEGRLQKFRAAYQGEAIGQVFATPWAGKTMEDVVPMSLRSLAIEAARECVQTGCVIYTIISTLDTQGQRVDCERLLLPFGSGSKVTQMLASLQLTQVPGGIRRKKILSSFEIEAKLVFAGRIASGFTDEAAAAASGVGGGEHRRAQRRNVRRAGRIRFGRTDRTCTVRNISSTGALIEGANIVDLPDRFALTLDMETAARRCTVVWRKKVQLGVRFVDA